MTDEEKELQEKMKQYQYELEENQKKMERLEKDMHKGNKKSFIYKFNKTIGRIVFCLSMTGVVIITGLFIFALTNYFKQLQNFDAVQAIEDRYDMNLKTLSREVGDKKIVYKVKPKKLKYKNIEFTVLRENFGNWDDFDYQYLKYIIEGIEDKQLLEGFTIEEEYQENGLLKYRLVCYDYEDINQANQKIQNLKDYIYNYDKNAKNIIGNISQMITINKEK